MDTEGSRQRVFARAPGTAPRGFLRAPHAACWRVRYPCRAQQAHSLQSRRKHACSALADASVAAAGERAHNIRRPPALRRGRNPPPTSRRHALRHGRACCCEDLASSRPVRAGERRPSVTPNERRRSAGVKMASGCGSRMRAGGSPLKPSSPGKSEEGNATPARARLASRAMAPHHVRECCARPTWAELWPAR